MNQENNLEKSNKELNEKLNVEIEKLQQEEIRLVALLKQTEEKPSNSEQTKNLIQEQIKTINKQKDSFNEAIKNNKQSFNL